MLEMWNPAGWMGGIKSLLARRSWSRERIEAFQTRQLRAVVRHAGERVPYYRRLFADAALNPDDIRSLADLSRIPITTRSDLQQLAESEIVTEGVDPRKLVIHRTNGSTAAPLTIRRTRFEECLLQAFRLKALFSLGFRPTDRRLIVTSLIPVAPASRGRRPTPFHCRLGLLRSEPVDCLLPPEELLSRFRESNPEVLGGYPGTLSWLTGFLTEEDRRQIRPRFVLVGAESLTAVMRRQISEGFGAPVYDYYGAHEFNLVAAECPSSGLYHVSEETMIVEILRDGKPVKPGEAGELVGTALFSYAMPFIRYRLGDWVTLGETGCPCGAAVGTIQAIQGRIADRFPLPGGGTVHPHILEVPLVGAAPWIWRYQIVQEQPDLIKVKTVPLPGSTPSPEVVAELERYLSTALKQGVRIIVEMVKQIPLGAGGKFCNYVSLASRAAETEASQ